MIKTSPLLLLLVFSFATRSSSQTLTDSLAGFDEAAAIRASISQDFTGPELRVHLLQLKRNYIKEKFSLATLPIRNDQDFHKSASVPACVNEDFEASLSGPITSSTQISGWTTTRGYNTNGNNNCNLSGCCVSPPSEAIMFVAPNGTIDPVIGNFYPIYSVFGSVTGNTNAAVVNPQITSAMMGNNFIRINSGTAGDFSMEKISKTFSVSSSNALFRFAFISVLSAGHLCCDAGGFVIRVTNVTTNSLLTSVSYSASGISSSCSNTTGINYLDTQTGAPATFTSSFIFNKWHLNYVDLSPYIGQAINIEAIAGDCTAGGHYCYTYFDSQCGPMEILVNGLGKNTSCNATATVSAPTNLNSYQWSGPSGFTSSAPSFTTVTAGVYSLTIPQNPPYQPIQKTLSLVISPASVSVSASKPAICSGEKVLLNASGLITYSWSNGVTSSTAMVSPGATTTYTLTGFNSANCAGYALLTVSVNACTSIDKMGNHGSEILLFPNPNYGEFTVGLNAGHNKADLVIVNNLGQIVHSQVILKGENKVRTRNLPAGTYYYSVIENGSAISKGKITLNN